MLESPIRLFRSYDDELKAWEVDMLWQAGTHIMGRKVYEEMAEYWPSSTEVFAPPMNEIPKVVFSTTIKKVGWSNSRIAEGDTVDAITRLKREPGKNILAHGGAGFAQTLFRLGLVDELRLIVHPVVLSGGLALFSEAMDLKLSDSRVFPAGVVALTYRCDRGRPA